MTAFTADWLRLREPFDHLARAAAWPALDVEQHVPIWRAAGPVLQVVDLACGSGANLRALAPRLGGAQHWRLVDHDPALLAALPAAMAEWAHQQGYTFAQRTRADLQVSGPGFHAELSCESLDLVHDLGKLDLAATHLVTASALLDLVSAAWLQALTRQVQDTHAALLFALNVDGRTQWNPADPDDGVVHGHFSQHQLRDKGFGPALGAQAATAAWAQWTAAGYQLRQARSDWIIEGVEATAMHRAMIDGMAAAALEQQPDAHDVVHSWVARRNACIETAQLQVGHVDLIATR